MREKKINFLIKSVYKLKIEEKKKKKIQRDKKCSLVIKISL